MSLSASRATYDCSWSYYCVRGTRASPPGFFSGPPLANASVYELPWVAPRTADSELPLDGQGADWGQWVPQDIETYAYLAEPDFFRYQPHCDRVQREYLVSTGVVPRWQRFAWQLRSDAQTPTRRRRPSTPGHFCGALANLSIAFVGDSMMLQLYEAIEAAVLGVSLRWKNADAGVLGDRSAQAMAKSTMTRSIVCDGGTTLYYARRDGLDMDAVAHAAERSDFLILNWGVHFVPDAEMAFRMAVLTALIDAHWGVKPRDRIIWRASLSAHQWCKHDVAVEPSVGAVASRWNAMDVLTQDRNISWPTIRSRIGGRVLRVDVPSRQRVDGHRIEGRGAWIDCLHYCAPGVPDTWAEQLVAMIRASRHRWMALSNQVA